MHTMVDRRRRRRRRVCLDVGLKNKEGNWISTLVKFGNMKTVLICRSVVAIYLDDEMEVTAMKYLGPASQYRW